MNRSEFNTWMLYHQEAMGPSLASWLGENDGSLTHWYQALQDVELNDAREATNLIVNGDAPRPQGWSLHPAAIRRLAHEFSSTRRSESRPSHSAYIDGQRTYLCGRCQDKGVLSVWNPLTLLWVRDCAWDGSDVVNPRALVSEAYRDAQRGCEYEHPTKGITVRLPAMESLSVACSCEAGDNPSKPKMRQGREVTRGLVRFDPRKMLEFRGGCTEHIGRFLAARFGAPEIADAGPVQEEIPF